MEQESTMIDEPEHTTELGCAEDSRQPRLFLFLFGLVFLKYTNKVQIIMGGGLKKKEIKKTTTYFH